ncbi:MAG TPA: class I mannose-6-phosphate isomerase [Alloprevotella sp.]|nr:class I mannose-6-phosphate isomerase [Alloprevotella sp.]
MQPSKLPILKFTPIFKSVLWGGKRIAQFKNMPPQGDHVGESWELSPMKGNESVVSEGPMKGRTLPELMISDGEEIMGKRLYANYGDKFPLLIKFIDSTDDLSIQVHPDDELAAKRHNSLGKTEMWFSVLPAEGAYLYAGFKKQITPEQFRAMVADNTIVDVLGKFYPKRGDMFFLPAGRVHSIGRGNFVLEIQEASDITSRIYDYDRRDAQGNPRQLHIEESVDSITYNDTEMTVDHFEPKAGEEIVMESCPFFTTTLMEIEGTTTLKLAERDSFSVVISTRGNAVLTAPDGSKTILNQGETVLVPASMESLDITASGDSCEIVTTYI